MHVVKRLLIAGAILFTLGLVGATEKSSAQAVSQAYHASDEVQNGMIVMLDLKDSRGVVPLSNEKDSLMHGVVVSANDTAISLGGDNTKNQVYVTASGKHEVLVSTQNGSIKVGDIISISSIDGVGMKANGDQSTVLGKALTAFDGQFNVSGNTTLTTTVGKRNVLIGKILVDIGVSHNPLAANTSGPPVPAFLRKAGDIVGGKSVSSVRLYIAAAILLATMFVSGSLLYGGVRSSFAAIGRNPLAKKSIARGLLQVVSIGVMIFFIGVGGIYLVLRL